MATKRLAFFLISLAAATVVPASCVGNSTEFLRICCGATRYPRLCFNSMAGYASTVQGSPVQVAQLATNLTIGRIDGVSRRLTVLRHRASGLKAAVLSDCAEALADAADQAQLTAAELAGLAAAVGPEVSRRVSNAQTWMSAALTNEETCTDGFDVVRPCPIKAEVCRRVRRVKHFTSNALALVNNLVTTR